MFRLMEYLRYFFFLAFHWNVRLAFFILFYEIRGERKFGTYTTGVDDLLDSVSESDRRHASIYQPVNFFIAEWLFTKANEFYPDKRSVRFLDAGCGKGRTLLMAAFYGFTRISGFDISPAMCHYAISQTEEALNKYPAAGFSIDQANALDVDIPDDTGVIFLFNPFDEHIMRGFANRVNASLKRAPRQILLLYANPECRKIWEETGFKKIDEIRKMKWLHGMVFLKQKAGN